MFFVFLRSKKDSYQSDNLENILKQSLLKFKKLKEVIETKEGEKKEEETPSSPTSNNNTDLLQLKQSSKFSQHNVQLQNRIKELESSSEAFKSSWEASEKIIDELTEQWDDLSLRAKIVIITKFKHSIDKKSISSLKEANLGRIFFLTDYL